MNYTTYYSRGQKVFLINITPGRDESLFEAFSATISACDNRQLELRPRYTLHHGEEGLLKPGMQFKVTAESFGAGVQFSGEVSSISSTGFVLKPLGQIEMYQRSQVPRMDITLGFRAFTRAAPLEVFRQEWQRVVDGMAAGNAAKLELEQSQLNLGIGGLRSVVDLSERNYDLSLVFIELEAGKSPVCAVTEQLWRRTLPDDEGIAIGRRFVVIRKQDQARIQHHIEHLLKKQGKKLKHQKNNWELLDCMFREQ